MHDSLPGVRPPDGKTRTARAARWGALVVALTLMGVLPALGSPDRKTWSGRRIMDEVFTRHEVYPWVYEELTMVLSDLAGNLNVRQARRYSRVEPDGRAALLLVFDRPTEIRGVALLAERAPSGKTTSTVYLPALKTGPRATDSRHRGRHLLGTDFAVADLTPESRDEHRYIRRADQLLEQVPCFVVDAVPLNPAGAGYARHRHLIRQDNLVIVRTDYFDHRGRAAKRQTRHDLKRVDGDMWRANMRLMENLRDHHRTLLKIDRRVFSRDYVPREMFSPQWLRANRHMLTTGQHLLRRASNDRERAPADPGVVQPPDRK